MRKITLLILIGVFCNQTNLWSQSFPRHSAVWLYQYYDDFHLPTNDFTQYYMLGDTVINSVAYSKVYSYNNDYLVAYRDTNRLVYYILATDSVEKLGMDFNIATNDSLNGISCGSSNMTSVDSGLYFGGNHKHVDVNDVSVCADWVENVGPTANSPVYPCCHGLSGNYILICYQESNLDQHYSQWATGCFAGLQETSSEQLKVFPNPTHSIAYLNTEKYTGQNYSLINSTGQIICNGLISADQINLTGLPNGIYFLKIGELNQVYVKLIKN